MDNIGKSSSVMAFPAGFFCSSPQRSWAQCSLAYVLPHQGLTPDPPLSVDLGPLAVAVVPKNPGVVQFRTLGGKAPGRPVLSANCLEYPKC